jgi:hypothetical protein
MKIDHITATVVYIIVAFAAVGIMAYGRYWPEGLVVYGSFGCLAALSYCWWKERGP